MQKMSADPEPEQGAVAAAQAPAEELDDQTITRELCAVNGINYEKLMERGTNEKVTKLESFFFGYPRITSLHYFPQLSVLCIVNQPIRSLSGLETCKALQELWVCEATLDSLKGVEDCVCLKQLYLYTNRIDKIEGLGRLVRLEKLWLNGNRLSRVEGLDTLRNLKDLNLARNHIISIEKALENLKKLEILDLSGNHLSSFKDLSSLALLPWLRSLSLSHPHYAPNPLSLLCNYSSLLLYRFPRLEWLDGQDVSPPNLKLLVQGLVLKKKQFYRMKSKHAQEVADRKYHTHQQEVKQLKEVTYSRLRTFHSVLKTLQLNELDARHDREEKMRTIRKRIDNLTGSLVHVDRTSAGYRQSLSNTLSRQILLWEIELESGGNVKFSPGGVEMSWYKSCVDLVNSRFSAASVLNRGLSGVAVKQVLRIENRKLHNRMTSAVQTILERRPDSIPPHNSISDLVEYLFLVWRPGVDLMRVCQDGFEGDDGGSEDGKPRPVHLTNSISLADTPRLRQSSEESHSQGQRSSVLSHDENESELLLCKVFKGSSAEFKNPGIPSSLHHRSLDCVYRQGNSTECCEWFVFHSSLVVPKFLISIQYTSQSQEPSRSVLDHMMSHDPQTPSDGVILDQAPPLPAQPKLALLDEASVLRVANATTLSSVQNLCLHGNRLSRFRLSSCPPPLTHSLLPSLTSLTLSCNELHTAEDFQNLPHLKVLDIGFNKLTSLEGMKSLPKLRQLDISCNGLTCFFTDIGVLRRHTPALSSLDSRHNPWDKPELFRRHTIGHLKSLLCLDGSPVTADETASALRHLVSSQLSQSSLSSHVHTDTNPTPSLSLSSHVHTDTNPTPSLSLSSHVHTDTNPTPSLSLSSHVHTDTNPTPSLSLSSHVHTDTNPTPSLSLSSTAHCLQEELVHHPLQLNDSIQNWGAKVTSVHLAGMGIRRLACFDQLPNLQWLCLDNNTVNNIEPLSLCSKLQDLSLDRNMISDISPLCSLAQLKMLSVDHNNIATLPNGDQLKKLTKLKCASACHNHIASLAGIEGLVSLAELYASSNNVQDRRQLFHLKPLSNLVVLSLANNPLATTQEVGVVIGGASYRMFTAYHLLSLKALDGAPLDPAEVTVAKERLGGRLTQDVIFERSPGLELSEARTLDLPHCGLKSVDLVPVSVFSNLASLNLEHNCLTSFSGLVHLNTLKVLCLNHNRIESLVLRDISCDETVMKSLEVLHLAYNGISNLPSLQLSRIPSLRALFLQGNEITRADGLTGLSNLTELVLDRNKIKTFHELDLSDLTQLQVLTVEENRLRNLSHFFPLSNLERLFLGSNKVQDYSEIDKLCSLSRLLEMSLINNPISRRHQHRTIAIFNLPSLLSLDGVHVTAQERENAEAIFSITEQPEEMDMMLPGLPNRPAHLRVMNVPFALAQPGHAPHHPHKHHRGQDRR